MGTMIELTAADGHKLGAYRTGPADAKHGLVLIQEIFGVNHHIRSVADRFAAEGYEVIAPAMFDRGERDFQSGYTQDDVKLGAAARSALTDEMIKLDVAAAAAALGDKPLGIVGYCFGGTVAWNSACRTTLFKAASGWYGGAIAKARTETPNCPVQLHFGELDHSIPVSDVELIREAQPNVEIYVYEGAQHGFGCDERASYNAQAYELARQRTLEFFAKHLA
jgi:carboxymethylenebutenolidase